VLIQKLQPVFAITFASLFLKERPPKIFYLWSASAITGAYVMTFGLSIPNLNSDKELLEAAFFALIATSGFAASTVFGKRALRHVDFEAGTYLRFIIMSILMIAVAAALNDLKGLYLISADQWGILIMIAVMTGGTASFLYYYGLKIVSASVSTICELAFPLTAIILEYFLRGDMLSAAQWLGVLLLFVSIIKVSHLQVKSER
jgi:drug/metabolite transporter (DMT)-like permease